MKKFFLFALIVSSIGLKAQISTFDIDQKTLVYINYMPGDVGYDYNYNSPSDFQYQYNSILEAGAIIPVWKKFNANVGIGSTVGFQELELFQTVVDYDPGYNSTVLGTGLHLKTGVSYSLQISNIQVLPNIGVVWNTEKVYYWDWNASNDTYQLNESYSGLWGVFDAGIDVVYKNFLVGLTYTDIGWYYGNYLNVGFKLGYAFEKKSQMNF